MRVLHTSDWHIGRRFKGLDLGEYQARALDWLIGLIESERVDVLSRRSIREKLLCYFNQLAEKEGSRTFQLPFSLSMLADYIATDRSAMMRELKRLKEEGVLRSEGRRITLCTG